MSEYVMTAEQLHRLLVIRDKAIAKGHTTVTIRTELLNLLLTEWGRELVAATFPPPDEHLASRVNPDSNPLPPFLDWGGRTQPLPDLHPKE